MSDDESQPKGSWPHLVGYLVVGLLLLQLAAEAAAAAVFLLGCFVLYAIIRLAIEHATKKDETP